ncbi:MAG TPA: cation diffusion facilitator family transporter [Syntrophales bacterium]|nr:cation diffusion facilitator family transporter [Syntrophales bacterium]HNS53611.1 cation diffusion facilitator family transporter [Syntrophales bacterium]
MDPERRKKRIALLSVFSNATLVALKLAVGLAIGAVSVLSEAIHSGVDLVASGVAYYSVRTSGIPADREHPYGHGKIENVSGTVEALLIFLAAAWIVAEAVGKIIRPEPLEMAGWGAAVMLLSAAVNIAVSSALFRVGKETDSVALIADGWHLRTDVYTSAGVMAGLGAIWAASHVAPGVDLHWVDPAAALGVAALILKAAWDLTRRSARDLLDARLPGDEVAWIEALIRRRKPVVAGFHKLRTRKAGPFRFIEVHLKVDAKMTVEDSHRITQDFAREIRGRFPGATVTTHIEPCDGACGERCTEGCLLDPAERGAVGAAREK